ncbi:HNH endonuclease [Nocardioides immobilis]|uniref:HNH endonuclease n=2 Tax=Nocardioides immobilis TaxID=2049295 RepID=A0A417Y0E5_9ACTN|nr:HNH endonuclease [Nocardioides immobilis]
MLAELKLRVLAAAGDVAMEAGARDVGAWLAHQTRADSSTARAEARLAQALDRRWTAVAAGMADGTVSAEQARVIVAGLDNLPDRVGTEVIAKAEEQLVDYARDYRPSELRRLARHILDVVAPEIAEAEAAKRLEAEEQRAREKTRLSLRPVGDGTTRLSGIIPDEAAARLRTYLEAFTSPRKANDAPTGEEDRIPYPRKLGRAFCALIEHLNPRKLPAHGGDASTVMVTITEESLIKRLATGGLIDADLSAGDNLSAEAIGRLACTAGIIPVVLGGKGEILDLGRTRRLFSPAQRKAMALRDKTCRGEGCTVPAPWCEAHHLKPWSQGGKTDIADGILGCPHHHHLLHDPNYTHEILPNGDIRFHRRR